MISLDRNIFSKEVLEDNGLVLVDYWSDRCENCIALMPYMEELSNEFGDKLKFTKLNIKGNTRIAIKQKILGLPTISLYRDGVKIAEVTKDDATKENIRKMVEEVL